jgi:hypothetical protein
MVATRHFLYGRAVYNGRKRLIVALFSGWVFLGREVIQIVTTLGYLPIAVAGAGMLEEEVFTHRARGDHLYSDIGTTSTWKIYSSAW